VPPTATYTKVVPMRTPSFTPESSPTLSTEALATLTALSTMDAVVAQHPELGGHYSDYRECVLNFLYGCEYIMGLEISPNGKWAVFFTSSGEPEKAGGGLKFIHLNSSTQWEVYFAELYFAGTEYHSDAGVVNVVHWTPDGRYVYVEPSPEVSGGWGWFWRQGIKLFRLDLQTGQWIDTYKGSEFSFAPDGQSWAYQVEGGVHVFRDGQDQGFSISPEFINYGRFTWSPDGNQIIFAATKDDSDTGNYSGITLLVIDLGRNEVKVVVDNDDRLLYPLTWPESNRVMLGAISTATSSSANIPRYFLDLDTQEIMPITTP
jgi:hypothetical protein